MYRTHQNRMIFRGDIGVDFQDGGWHLQFMSRDLYCHAILPLQFSVQNLTEIELPAAEL